MGLFLAMPGTGAGECDFPDLATVQGEYERTASLNGQMLFFDGFCIQNNTWGIGHAVSFDQFVFANADGSEFGWSWDWPLRFPLQVRAYPEAIIGKKPWNTFSTCDLLPAKISDIVACQVDYARETCSTGACNTALDIFLTHDAEADVDAIALELMIWLESGGMTPLGAESTAHISGRSLPLYYAERLPHGDWSYACFLAEDTGHVNIMEYVWYLVANRYIPRNLFLASIEFGNEVLYGRGLTKVSNLAVTVQTSSKQAAPGLEETD